MNGGTCTNTDTGIKCKCKDGYTGKLCEKGMFTAHQQYSYESSEMNNVLYALQYVENTCK